MRKTTIESYTNSLRHIGGKVVFRALLFRQFSTTSIIKLKREETANAKFSSPCTNVYCKPDEVRSGNGGNVWAKQISDGRKWWGWLWACRVLRREAQFSVRMSTLREMLASSGKNTSATSLSV